MPPPTETPAGSIPFLKYGRFIGAVQRGVDVAGFSVADIVDTGAPVPVHTHESAHVSFIVSGPYHTTARGFDGHCAGGALLYNPPYTTHRDRCAEPGGRFLTISLADSLLASVVETGALPRCSLGLPERETGFLGTRFLLDVNGADGFSGLVLESLMFELLGQLRRIAEAREGSEPAWLRSACDYLRDAAEERVAIRSVARSVGVHPVHLARGFRRHRACTPGEYLRRVRVERAARRIAAGCPLAEAAHASGFGDQSQLTKSFRRVLGCTPGAYRRLTRC